MSTRDEVFNARAIMLMNYSGEIPPHAICEIFEIEHDVYKVTKPTQDNLPPGKCVANGIFSIPPMGKGIGFADWPVRVLTTGVIDRGMALGTRYDSWALASGYGFIANPKAGETGSAFVTPSVADERPLLVKAVSDPIDGYIDVVSIDADGTEIGSPFSVRTLPYEEV